MSWFKADDKLPDNRKARAVRKSHPDKLRDVAPFGIWVLAGAWSDDGFVPLEVLQDWDDDAEALAARLVAAKLWHKTKRDGEPGFVFHDWADQNPARDDNDPSKAGTFGNHVRWHVQLQKVNPDCEHCPTEPDEEAESIGANRGDIAPDSKLDRGESLPSRPDPTRTRPEPDQLPRPMAETEIDRFDEFWDAYDHKVGRRKAEQKYRLALKKPGVDPALLINAAASYVAWVKSEGKHPEFTKHPATWLNGEHWTDERVARPAPVSRVQSHLQLARELSEQQPAAPLQIGDRR